MKEKICKIISNKKDFSWALIDQAVVSGTNFLVNILLAKLLGVEEFGLYVIIITIILLASMLHQAVVITPMMNIGPKIEANKSKEYRNVTTIHSLIVSGGLSIFFFFFFFIAKYINEKWDISELSIVTAITIFLLLVQDYIRRYFFLIKKQKYSFFTDVLKNGVFITAILVLNYFYNIDAKITLIILSASTFLAIIPFYTVFNFSINSLFFKEYTIRNWNFSKWLFSGSLIQWVSDNTFMLGAGAFLGTSAVGGLKAVQSLFGVTHIFFNALENIVPIRIAPLIERKNFKEVKKYLIKIALMGLSMVLVFSILFILKKDFLFTKLYSKEYLSFSFLIKIVAVFYLFMALINPLIYLIKALEKTKVFLIAQIIISIVFFFTVEWLTKKIGIIAQPVSSLIYQLILVIVIVIYFRKSILKFLK